MFNVCLYFWLIPATILVSGIACRPTLRSWHYFAFKPKKLRADYHMDGKSQ
jgi:hypothetical protein